MTGIAIPPITPGTVEGGSLWPGILAGVVLLVVLGLAVWTYVRNRPVRDVHREDEVQHLKAA
jgi:hypothetical protein